MLTCFVPRWCCSKGFTNADDLRGSSGCPVGGEKFMFIRNDEELMNIKKGAGGASIYKTAQCLVLGAYNQDMSAGANSIQVGKIADYLKDAGY